MALTVPYQDYLRSPEWQVVKRIAIDNAGDRCQVCNSPGPLQVHHRTYERVGRELLPDVTVLCETCHERYHGIGQPPREVLYHGDFTGVPDDGEPLPISQVESRLQDRIASECFATNLRAAA